MWLLRYASVQTNSQTDTHTTTFRTLPWHGYYYYAPAIRYGKLSNVEIRPSVRLFHIQHAQKGRTLELQLL